METTLEHEERHVVTRYRQRDIGESELAFIREKIAEQAGRPGRRKAVAESICVAWDWRQRRGTLSTRACGDLLRRLEDWGHIELPPSSRKAKSRATFPLLPADLIPLTGFELCDPDADLKSLVVRPIVREEQEGWRLYMGRYHYLGYRPIVGEHIQYAAFLGGELVALLGWGSAALRAPLRESYIGWDESMKSERLHLVADNVRFLVLPWVRVKNLASKILATNLRRLSDDWQERWAHPIHLAETFVDTRRFRGTCYRASNWRYLGQTAGRTRRGNAYLHEGSPKGLFVYPLHRQATKLLAGATTPAAARPAAAGACRSPPEGQALLEPQIPWAPPLVSPSLHSMGKPSEHASRSGLEVAASFAGPSSAAPEAEVAARDGSPAQSLPAAQREAPVRDGGPPELEQRAPSNGAGAVAAKAPELRGRSDSTVLTPSERIVLDRLARGLTVAHRTVVRAKLILLLADGETLPGAGKKVGLGRRAARSWALRFARKRLAGLEDEPRSGRPARFSP